MKKFNLRMDKEIRDDLDLIAQKYKRSRADIIRLMIEEEATAIRESKN